LPAHLGVGTEDLPLDERNSPVAQLNQVLQGKRRRTIVIKRNVGYPSMSLCLEICDGRKKQPFLAGRVDCYQSFYAALEKKLSNTVRVAWGRACG